MTNEIVSGIPNVYWTLELGHDPLLLLPDINTQTIYACSVWKDEIFVLVTGMWTNICTIVSLFITNIMLGFFKCIYCTFLDDHMLHISVDGKLYKKYYTMPHLQGVPTSVLVFKNLLILGLDSGR